MENKIEKYKKELPGIKKRMQDFGMDVKRIERETSFALQILNDARSSQLQKCTKDSVLKSIVNIGQINLTLNPISKEAYLIPRWNSHSQQLECHLEPSYIGLVKLLTDAGSVTSIQTNLVYENDEYEVTHSLQGTDFIHKPTRGERGKIIGVYAVATLQTGDKQFEEMTREEVESIRDVSESYKAYKNGKIKTCIWTDYEGEMYRKTVLKRIQKYLPRTKQMQYVDNAVNLLNKDFTPSTAQCAMAADLIRTSTLIEPTKEQLERELPNCNVFQLTEMIGYLKDHQPDPIRDQGTSGQKEIQAAIDSAMDRDKDPELFK